MKKEDEALQSRGLSRIDFLKLGVTAGAALAVSGVAGAAMETLRIPTSRKTKRRYAMVIDLARCVGCGACTVACKVEHNVPVASPKDLARKIQWTEVHFHETGEFPYVKTDLNPRPCMHCEKPPCVDVCPVGATYRDEDRGLVLQRYERCIGCRYCTTACPYGARYFNWSRPDWGGELREAALNPDPHPHVKKRYKGIVEKCTFCVERLDRLEAKAEREGKPISDDDLVHVCACVKTCMGRARYMGDLNDPESTVSKLTRSGKAFRLLEELGTEPKVIYLRPN